MNTILNGMMRERQGHLQVQHKYQRLKKAVASTEDSGIASTVSHTSPPHRGKDQDDKNYDKNQDKRLKKGQQGRPAKAKNDKKGNNNNNNDTTPKKVVVIKTEKSKNNNVTTTPVTPAVTRERART